MKYLAQFLRILAIAFCSEILHAVLPLPVPASIYGIIILFLLLETGLLKLEKVKETGKFLIEIMPVMFVPAAAGLIDSWDMIRPSLLAYGVIIVVSTIVVMAVSGLVTQLVIHMGKQKSHGAVAGSGDMHEQKSHGTDAGAGDMNKQKTHGMDAGPGEKVIAGNERKGA